MGRRALAAVIGVALATSTTDAHAGTGFGCRRNLGLAGGLVYAPRTWERIGKKPTYFDLSPVIGGACGVSAGPFSMWVSADWALTYDHYSAATGDFNSGWLTATVGLQYGEGNLRGGGHVVGDLTPVGAGVNGTWIFGDPLGAWQGIEARLTGYWVQQPNVQLMLLYTIHSPLYP